MEKYSSALTYARVATVSRALYDLATSDKYCDVVGMCHLLSHMNNKKEIKFV